MDLCAKKGHDFRPFDDRSLYCPRCGEFRVAPSVPTYVPVYPQPYTVPYVVPYVPWGPFVWSGTTSVSTGLEIGNATYGDTTDQSTYTVLS